MKKLLAILLALMVVGGALSAQIVVNGYDRATLTWTDDNAVAWQNRVRLNLSFTAADGSYGFWGRLQSSDGTAPSVSYGYGWALFADKKVKFTAGKLGNYDYSIGTGYSDWALGNVVSDAYMFDATQGFLLQILPSDALSIGVSYIPSTTLGLTGVGVEAAYTIKDFGKFVVVTQLNSTIENSFASAAFQYNGTKGFDVTVGAQYGSTIGWHAFSAQTINAFAIANVSADKLSAQVAPAFVLGNSEFYVEGNVSYALTDALTGVVLFGYDTTASILGSTYLAGGEVYYKQAKGATLLAGGYYDGSEFTIRLSEKVKF
jgi:hypothetical protein